jgi:tripartite-type tricarboxylate transporter receptor subunit TctC
MKLARRKFLNVAAGAVALPAVSRRARAQTYPSRPVRIVVGFPPGGATDIYGRLIGQSLSERLGQSFFVENRTGAGGNIATETVVRASPDGYTLLLISSSDAWSANLYDNLKFNFIQDIAPVAGISRGMGVLVVHPALSSKSLPELIVAAKANPGKITMASAGIGSLNHMYWELFKSMAQVDMLHVPYRGGAPALTDLIGGQVQAFFSSVPLSIEYIKTGKLRPLAVTAATRAEVLPDVPTVGEFVSDYDATHWFGIGVPRNTPVAIIDKLNQEIVASLAEPKLKQQVAELGDTVFSNSSAEFSKFIADYTDKWGKVIRAAKIKAE